MGNVSILEIKPGVKLTKNVLTPLGGVLLHKGKVLLPRDLEILRAFLVKYVDIEGPPGQEEVSSKKNSTGNSNNPKVAEAKNVPQASSNKESSLSSEYDKMVSLTKNTYQSAVAIGISMYELRNQLENLFLHLSDYSILSFVPRSLNDYDYMYHHAVLCALSSYKLAQWSGLPQKDWMQVAFAGLLHDIGNTRVDPAILYKSTPLTSEEVKEVRSHTTYGYQMLKSVTAINEGVRLTALQHHEKVDSTGYPLNIDGNKIHVYAKIVGVTDIFHAMTLNKNYRKAQSPYLVLDQIHSEAFGKLDPTMVQTFIRKVTEFQNGILVRLSSDQIGEIIYSDHNHPTRPMVSVDGQIIDLQQQRQLYIEEIIK